MSRSVRATLIPFITIPVSLVGSRGLLPDGVWWARPARLQVEVCAALATPGAPATGAAAADAKGGGKAPAAGAKAPAAGAKAPAAGAKEAPKGKK